MVLAALGAVCPPAAGQQLQTLRFIPDPLDANLVNVAVLAHDGSLAQRQAAIDAVDDMYERLAFFERDVVEPWRVTARRVVARAMAGEDVDPADIDRIFESRRPILHRQREIQTELVDSLATRLGAQRARAVYVEIESMWRSRLPNARAPNLSSIYQRSITPEDRALLVEVAHTLVRSQVDDVLLLEELGARAALAPNRFEFEQAIGDVRMSLVVDAIRAVGALDGRISVESAWNARVWTAYTGGAPFGEPGRRAMRSVDSLRDLYAPERVPADLRNLADDFMRHDIESLDAIADAWMHTPFSHSGEAPPKVAELIADRLRGASAFTAELAELLAGTPPPGGAESSPAVSALDGRASGVTGELGPLDARRIAAWAAALGLSPDLDMIVGRYHDDWNANIASRREIEQSWDRMTLTVAEAKAELDAWLESIRTCDGALVDDLEAAGADAFAVRRLRALLAWRHANLLEPPSFFDEFVGEAFLTDSLIRTEPSIDAWLAIDDALTRHETTIVAALDQLDERRRAAAVRQYEMRRDEAPRAERRAAREAFEIEIGEIEAALHELQNAAADDVIARLDEPTRSVTRLQWIAASTHVRMPPIVDALARLVLALDELTPTERETVLETRIRWLRETLERAERLLELRTATTPWPPEDGEADRHAAYAWLELRDERRALLVEQDRADAATIVRLEIAARDRETFFEMISGR